MTTPIEPRVQAISFSSFFLLVPIFVIAVSTNLRAQTPDVKTTPAETTSQDAKFVGPKADLRGLGAAFSRNPSFRTVELSGTVSHPYDPKADAATFVITVDADGTTELRIRTSPEEFWEKYPPVGSLGTCSNSRKMTEHQIRLTSLRCSAPVSWVLPLATLQTSERTARVKSAIFSGSSENEASSSVTLWMGNSSNESVASDPVKRFTARQLLFDRTSGLPSVLRYEQAPVEAVPVTYSPPTVEIRYGDYREVSGYKVPFHIERYLGGQPESIFQIQNATIR